MGWVKNVVHFENNFTKNLVGDVIHDPTRLITGVDPVSTTVWNRATGSNKKPLVNMFGGPDEQYFDRAEEDGIDTGAARTFHKVADTIAGVAGAEGLAGSSLFSGAGAAGEGSGLAASGADTTGSVGGLGTTGATASGVDATIPSVAVHGTTAGTGLGSLGTATAGGLGGLAGMAYGGADPNIPQVHVNGSTGSTGNSSVLNGSVGSAGTVLTADQLGNLNTNLGNVGQPVNPNVSIPDNQLPPIAPVVTNPMPPGSVTDPSQPGSGVVGTPSNPGSSTGVTLPGGITPGDITSGLGSLFTGYQDYRMNQADKDYYQGLLDKMMGMYQPGTTEADLMQKQMEAKDAAAGRNSQYGVRAQNLAAQLAQQRANIMMSPTFGKIAEASRGHYDSSLASLSSVLGGANTSNTALNNLLTKGVNLGSSYLGSLFS